MPRSVPALLLSLVYAAALAVALTDLGQHAVAGLLVLGGLSARWLLRHRGASTAPSMAPSMASSMAPATAGDAVPAPARAT